MSHLVCPLDGFDWPCVVYAHLGLGPVDIDPDFPDEEWLMEEPS